jgi:hypothetical protein
MTRVGEPDPVPAVDHEIAGLVVVFAVEQRIDRDETPVRRELDQPPASLLRAVQLSSGTMGQAIHPIGVAAEVADAPLRRIEAKDQPLVDDAEEGTTLVPYDPAGGPLIGTGDELELPCHVRPAESMRNFPAL